MEEYNIKKINETDKNIKIFSTNDGLNVIKSPVKSLILSSLKEDERGFEEIVKIAKRSKSTVSAHLKALTEEGIINYKIHPADQRKKIFYLKSRYLGELYSNDLDELPEQSPEFLSKNFIDRDDPFEFFRLMFHTLRSVLIQEGFNIDPLLYQTGKKIGEVLFDQLEDDDDFTFINNIQQFWVKKGLGTIDVNVENKNFIEVIATDCYECEFLPQGETVSCFLDSGIIESLFEKHFDREIIVRETECFTTGYNHCKFEVKMI